MAYHCDLSSFAAIDEGITAGRIVQAHTCESREDITVGPEFDRSAEPGCGAGKSLRLKLGPAPRQKQGEVSIAPGNLEEMPPCDATGSGFEPTSCGLERRPAR